MSALTDALSNQGYNEEEVRIITDGMLEKLFEGCEPEEVLGDYGLEPDYLEDLIC